VTSERKPKPANSRDDLEAATARVRTGDFEPLEVIIGALSHSSREIRFWAAYHCNQIGCAAAIPALSRLAVKDADSDVRSQALYALADVGRPAVVRVLIGGLRDTDPEPRAAARAGIFRMFGRQMLPLLSEEEDSGEFDPTEAKRIAAWWSEHRSRFDPRLVYAFGQPAGPGAFIRFLKASKVGGGSAMLIALKEWTGQDFDQEPLTKVIAKWEKWWSKNRSSYEPGHRYFYSYKVPTK
jgi:hypothetical protein